MHTITSKAIQRLSLYGAVTILSAVLFLIAGCASEESGPFPYPDGIYEGASDLYD